MPQTLNWLLDDLVTRVPEARQAIVLSGDGLLIASSRGVSRADAEHLSAVASGFQSLARGAGARFNCGGVKQTVIEMDRALLFVTAAGARACLAVLSDAEPDVGFIAYEMAVLVQRVGQFLTAGERAPVGSPSGA